MGDASTAFLKGGLGCLGAAILGGSVCGAIGGNFRIDLGGIILVGLAGGALGLALHTAYERGRRDALLGTATDTTPTEAALTAPTSRAIPFTSRWSADSAISVADALAEVVERQWRGESPVLRHLGHGSLEVTFRPRERASALCLRLVADAEADEVVVRFQGPRGEAVLHGGPWRGDFASNAHLRKTYDFVQDLLEERVVYVFDSRGAHRFVTRGEVPRCIAVDPSGLVRSWNGSLDRGGDA